MDATSVTNVTNVANVTDASIAELVKEPKRSPLVDFAKRYQRLLVGTASLILMMGLWQLAADMRLVNPLFLSSPKDVFAAASQLMASGELMRHLSTSAKQFAVGFFLAVAIGVPIGVGLGWFPWFNMMFEPIISAVYAMPRVALVPLFIMWFGIGFKSKVIMIISVAVFPIIINTAAGFRNVDQLLMEMSRSFRATRTQMFLKVGVPSSIPFVFAGLRLAVGLGLIGVVIGEMFGAIEGIGFMILLAGSTFQTDRIFVGLFCLAIGGVLLAELVRYLERKLVVWHPDR